MSKWGSFAQGYMIGQRMVEDYNRAKKKRDLQEVASAEAIDTQEFTPGQIDDINAAADSGQYDFGVETDDKGEFKGYTVTPKSDPSQTGTIATRGVTEYLGKRYEGGLAPEKQDMARQMAMAGVHEKHGDVEEAMRLRREIKSQSREDERWDRQSKQWDREDKKLAEQDAYEAGRKELFASTRFGQNQGRYEQEMAKYQQDLAKHEADKAAGKPVGAAPVMPGRPEYSVGDALADRAALIDHDARHGKLDARSFGEFTEMLNRAQSEGYEKVLRLAQSGAPVQEIAKAFNASGKVQLDPASVVSDKMVKGKDGVETRVIQYKDGNGNVRTINALAELDALGKAGDVFTRHFQSKQDQRADRADARAGAQFAQGVADRADAKSDKLAKADAAAAIFRERNPNATEAELNAVRLGILDAVPTANKNSPAEVKLAEAMVASGLAPDMRTGLEMAITKKSQSAREAYLDLMKPQSGIAPREEDVAVVMETAYGPKWRDAVGGRSGGRSASGPVQDAPKVGAEQTVQSGPHKGKKAVWDGKGWVLRQ